MLHGPPGEQPTGVFRSSIELLRALCDLEDGPEIILLGDESIGQFEGHRKAPPRIPMPLVAGTLNRWVTSGSLRLSHLAVVAPWLARVAKAHDLEIVHDFTGLAPFPRRIAGTKTVATIHDLVSYRPNSTNDFVDDIIQRRWLPFALKHVDCVVTVSETVAAEARDIFRLGGIPVEAVYHGVDHVVTCAAESGPVSVPDEPYLLAVGVTSERKNLQNVVRAGVPGWRAGTLPPLLLVGPRGPVVERVLDTASSLGVGEHVRAVGYLSDAALAVYYSHAVALVYPSYDEGFGLPILEAMSRGTPVITSDRGATREVAGDAAVLVDPYDPASISVALARVSSDPTVRAELAVRGRQRAAEFTWHRSALRLQEIYARLLEPASPDTPSTPRSR